MPVTFGVVLDGGVEFVDAPVEFDAALLRFLLEPRHLLFERADALVEFFIMVGVSRNHLLQGLPGIRPNIKRVVHVAIIRSCTRAVRDGAERGIASPTGAPAWRGSGR